MLEFVACFYYLCFAVVATCHWTLTYFVFWFVVIRELSRAMLSSSSDTVSDKVISASCQPKSPAAVQVITLHSSSSQKIVVPVAASPGKNHLSVDHGGSDTTSQFHCCIIFHL